MLNIREYFIHIASTKRQCVIIKVAQIVVSGGSSDGRFDLNVYWKLLIGLSFKTLDIAAEKSTSYGAFLKSCTYHLNIIIFTWLNGPSDSLWFPTDFFSNLISKWIIRLMHHTQHGYEMSSGSVSQWVSLLSQLRKLLEKLELSSTELNYRESLQA